MPIRVCEYKTITINPGGSGRTVREDDESGDCGRAAANISEALGLTFVFPSDVGALALPWD
jgi:hypothetical protein